MEREKEGEEREILIAMHQDLYESISCIGERRKQNRMKGRAKREGRKKNGTRRKHRSKIR